MAAPMHPVDRFRREKNYLVDNEHREMAATCRAMLTAELLDWDATLRADHADYDPDNRAIADGLAWPCAIRAELARRRAHAAAGRCPSPDRYQRWADIAAEIRRRADMVHLVEQAGIALRPSRGGREWHGACPQCGGTDRLCVWPTTAAKPGRAWCRQCGRSWDALSLYRYREHMTFYEAVEEAARDLGIPLPPDPMTGARPIPALAGPDRRERLS